MDSIFCLFPQAIRGYVESLPPSTRKSLEEIRIREGRPLEVITSKEHGFIHRHTKQLTPDPISAFCPKREDCQKMINLISRHSLYTMEEELRQGYITVQGGHRIGLSGRVIVEQGKVKYIRDITSLNVRIAREVRGIGHAILPYILHNGKVENLLIVSPPQCGKTTLIRDLARLASTGTADSPAYKVGVIDERSEIAGCLAGVPQHDVGPRTDVLDACPKAEGMMMMIRSMSPEILVVDEIGRKEDSFAIHEAVFAGVHLFTTAHGYSLEDVLRRPILSELIHEQVFSRILLLSRRSGPGTIEGLYDATLQPVNTTRFPRRERSCSNC